MQAKQLKDTPIEDVGASKNYDLVMKFLGNIVPSDGIKGASFFPSKRVLIARGMTIN